MQPSFTPLKFMILTFADWISRRQLDVIEYERRRLARKAQACGRKVLNELDTLVTQDTHPNEAMRQSATEGNVSQ